MIIMTLIVNKGIEKFYWGTSQWFILENKFKYPEYFQWAFISYLKIFQEIIVTFENPLSTILVYPKNSIY